MVKFDFIKTEEFRVSLESDYAELKKCCDSKSWKSALVLSGSIIEALLIDYLTESPATVPKGKDILRLDLSEVIAISKDNKIISQRVADLCSVIRSYRNLIHPARQFRLKEQPPTKQSADIAVALVELVVNEIALVRKGAFGLTAEQVHSKLLSDNNSLSLLPHLIRDVHESELERLLLDIIPSGYTDSAEMSFEESDAIADRLQKAFRIIFNTVSKSIKTKVVNHFVQILKNNSGTEVDSYAHAFFIPSDITYLQEKDIPIVKEYYRSHRPTVHDAETAKIYSQLASFLKKAEIAEWLDAFMQAIVSVKNSQSERSEIRNALTQIQDLLSKDCAAAQDRRLDDWIAHYSKESKIEVAEMIKVLKKELQLSREIPF